MSSALDRIRSNSAVSELAAFKLILTAMYVFGVNIGNNSEANNAQNTRSSVAADDTTGSSSEELLTAMEKIAAIFDRLKGD